MASWRLKALFCLGLVLLLVGPVAAAPLLLPHTLTGSGATWEVTNSGGTNNGLPTGTSDFSPGLTVNDTTLGGVPPVGKDDAFDNGLTVWVNNAIFALVEPASADVTGQVLTAGPRVMAGLNVTVEYRAIQTSPTLRTLVAFQNPTAGSITVDVKWVSNVGSDAATVVSGSSSGDTTFTVGDRWLVTNDSDPFTQDVVNTFVVGGPGNPASPRTAASLTAFSDGTGNQGVTTAYSVTVPGGETRYLLFFNQINATVSAALAAAPTFDDNPLLTSDFMAGIVEAQLPMIVNWEFVPPPAPTGLSLVIRGTDNSIYHSRYDGTTWGAFVQLPGATADIPALASSGGAILDLVVRGIDDSIYHNHFDGTAWSGWTQLPGATADIPALAASGGGVLDLVVRGIDNGIYHNHYDGTTWSGWVPLPGATASIPALAASGGGVLDLVVRGIDNGVYHNHYDGTTWGGWTALPGATADIPALAASGGGVLDLVVRGTDNGVYHNHYDGTTWGGWTALPGATASIPALVASGGGKLDLAVRGIDNAVYHNHYDGTAWTGWNLVGGSTASRPALAVE
jgi:hypothetical protein